MNNKHQARTKAGHQQDENNLNASSIHVVLRRANIKQCSSYFVNTGVVSFSSSFICQASRLNCLEHVSYFTPLHTTSVYFSQHWNQMVPQLVRLPYPYQFSILQLLVTETGGEGTIMARIHRHLFFIGWSWSHYNILGFHILMSVVVETPEVVPKPCNLFFIGQLWAGAPRAAPPFHVYPSGGTRYHLLFTRPAFVTRRIYLLLNHSPNHPHVCAQVPPLPLITQTCKSIQVEQT